MSVKRNSYKHYKTSTIVRKTSFLHKPYKTVTVQRVIVMNIIILLYTGVVLQHNNDIILRSECCEAVEQLTPIVSLIATPC